MTVADEGSPMAARRTIRRMAGCAVSAACVIAALTVTAPMHGTNAATLTALVPAAGLGLGGGDGLLPFAGGLPFAGPSLGGINVAIGPTIIGAIINGGATVTTGQGSVGATIGSP